MFMVLYFFVFLILSARRCQVVCAASEGNSGEQTDLLQGFDADRWRGGMLKRQNLIVIFVFFDQNLEPSFINFSLD